MNVNIHIQFCMQFDHRGVKAKSRIWIICMPLL